MAGEFPIEDWEEEAPPYLWAREIFFFGATMFVMITMLNLLIAILGETFIRVYMKQTTLARKMRLRFLSAIDKFMIPKNLRSKDSPMTYLFVVTLTNEIQEDDDEV